MPPIVVSQRIPAYVVEAQRAVGGGSGMPVIVPTGPNEYNEAVSKPEGPDLRVDLPKFVDFLRTVGEDDDAGETEEQTQESQEKGPE